MSRPLKALFVAISFVSVGIGCASGAAYKDAVAQFQKGEYGSAFSAFRTLSESEDSNSRFYLGFMYNYGLGVARNLQRAIYWYEKSALAGNMQAQHNLGVLYISGVTGSPNYDMGIRWLHEAAQQGSTPSYTELGKAYLKRGEDLSDLCSAIYWYEKGGINGSSIPEAITTMKKTLGSKCDSSHGQ